jgi:quercetin dioxygenase-like cupin family protein
MRLHSQSARKIRAHARSLFLPFLLLSAAPQPALARDYAQATVEKLAVTSTNYAGQALAYPDSGKPEVTALVVHLPPGASTGWHKHPVPVYAYMLDGELTVRTENGIEKRFVKGEAIIEVMNLLHNGTNTGKGNASLVVFYTGIAGMPNVIKADKAPVVGDNMPPGTNNIPAHP